MKLSSRSTLSAGLWAGIALLGTWPALAPAQSADVPEKKDTPSTEATAPAKKDESVYTLSPFKVSTEKDRGYKATNATTGTRLNEAIKDLPMPISVITEKFLRDTGATDLRQALSYTAGIQLQSQNDQGTPGGAYQGPGGVNNPEGATANKSQTSYKIRGYVTDAVLRDGFRRQNSTDSINISRVEVAFGPTALLYGIGEFGGIVNYIPKSPEAKAFTQLGLSMGSFGFKRATLDTTGPVSSTMETNYRITGAWQSSKNWTDYFKESHNFISPAISFKPTKSTQIDIDYERGTQKISGDGFQNLRAMANVSGGDQGEHVGFYNVPGTNLRTFRWSGPDTYLNTTASNFRAQIAQDLGEHIHLLIGYNHSNATFSGRDVYANLMQNVGPASLQKTVNFGTPALNGVGDSNLNVQSGTVNNVIMQYGWGTSETENTHDQFRAESNFKYKFFEKSKWFAIDNSLLVGHSEETQTNTGAYGGTKDNTYNYKSPLDASPIVFGKQGDGTPDVAMLAKNDNKSIAWDQSTYLVYSAKLLDDRLMIVSGMRDDYSDNYVASHDAIANTTSKVRSPKVSIRTYQNGISFQITRHISAFALKAEGVSPNFSGQVDTNGAPVGPIVAKSKEFGLKFDLLEGVISGSVSSFKINRTGTPFFYWWAPTSNYHHFNPNKDIVYNVNNFSPSSVPGGSNGGNGAADASLAQWNAGVSAGAIYNKAGSWYVDASKTTGAAYLDAVFAHTVATHMDWPGWLYNNDGETNNAWDDRASSPSGNEYVVGSDQGKGWTTEFVITPNNNFQFVTSYTHINKIITSAGQFAKYPYGQDKWAVWNFPNTDWGLTGKPITTAYATPYDSSTWTGIGFGSGEKQDDTPEHQVTAWANYQFTEGSLKGWSAGLGAQWMSPREYQSGITHGAGQRITDKNGNIVVLKTPAETTINAMIKYAFKWEKHDASVQLNIDNVLDDHKLYGLIYAAPRNIHMEFDIKL